MAEVAEDIKTLGDKIVGLTLKQAVDLAGYLKDTYQIEPAAGGVVMAGGGGGGAAVAEKEEEKTNFDVILKAGGDKKIQVIKVVRRSHRPGSEGKPRTWLKAPPRPSRKTSPRPTPKP